MKHTEVARGEAASSLREALTRRFGAAPDIDPDLPGLDRLAQLAARRVQRRYLPRPVDRDLLHTLCACALSAPSKSDLQQADIVIVSDRAKHDAIADLLREMPWARDAAVFLVFCANGRRVPRISAMRGKPFPNDHLDAFFNPVVDAALVLMAFIQAADAVGLGSCPISVIRDHSAEVSALLDLPERVIPLAGLTLGWPADPGHLSARLPLAVTVHENRYADRDFEQQVDGYDRRRAAIHGFKQRDPARWGTAEFYGWSEDKARQYAVPQRADFGAFVRSRGFCLD